MSEIKGLRYAVLGNVALTECYCPICKDKTIVIDGRTDCCGYPITEEPEKYKIKSAAWGKRRSPQKRERAKAIEAQKGICPYCGYPFSQIMTRKKGESRKIVIPEIEMDHFIPFNYSANNQKVNFVACCNICNRIKSNKIFCTMEKARQYIMEQRDKKGYEPL